MRNLPVFQVFTAVALLGGCGARGAVTADGGPGDASVPGDVGTETQPSGRRSFDVTSGLAAPDGGMGAQLPPTHTFTLVLEPAESRIIVGAMGMASVVPVTTPDGATFRTTARFNVGAAGQGACAGLTSLEYQSLEVTVTATGLHGKATGKAQISCGDCIFTQAFSAVLSGAADVTAPFLMLFGPSSPDPFTEFGVAVSEPLPATAKARLVGTDGSHVDLEPQIAPGAVPLVTGFVKPNVILGFGDGYVIALDGLVDFAGLAGAADGLRLASTAAPPPVTEDGFESANGPALGAAAVVKDPAVVIAGSRSVYFGGTAAPPLGTVAPGGALIVRLALQPGDTKVRLSARGVSRTEEAGFAGQVNIGSVGHKATPSAGISMFEPATMTVVPDGPPVFLSPPKTIEFILPADVSNEVVVSIVPTHFDCGPSFAVNGLLIDDLRAE